VPATFSALAWIVTFIFLKETVKRPSSIASLFGLQKQSHGDSGKKNGASKPLLNTVSDADVEVPDAEKPLSLRALLTPRVILAAGNYAALSLVDIAFRAIYPLFLSTPIPLGGLGMDPPTIGTILSFYGVFNGVFQVFFFARIHDRFGSKITFLSGILSSFPAFISFPIISYMAKRNGLTTLVWAGVIFQTLISIGLSLSYGAIFIFIAAASPNRASLGATNGLSQMVVSLMRALGPAVASSLFSVSIEKGYLSGYLVYYMLLLLCCFVTYTASLLPRKLWTR